MTTEGREPHVLVVEDDPTTCELIAELLIDEGYRVLQTGSGSVGLRLAKQYHPEAVVLDMMLGDVSGLDVLRELKQAAPTRDIRVVAISGSAKVLEEVEAQQADATFLKPFALADLLNAISGQQTAEERYA
ncbi:MAG TPA: response regulator [Chloroflexota bacterium]|jgi:DNA-binding response OmpR family regulator|nr:response regulator [Chloroflexota bacterium]